MLLAWGEDGMTDNPYQSPHESFQPSHASSTASILGWHLLAPLASGLGTVVLVVAVLHVHADRSKSRQPIITYEGLFAPWMPQLIYVGLGLSLLGVVAGMVASSSRHKWLLIEGALHCPEAHGVYWAGSKQPQPPSPRPVASLPVPVSSLAVRLSSGCAPTSIVRGRGGRLALAFRCTTG